MVLEENKKREVTYQQTEKGRVGKLGAGAIYEQSEDMGFEFSVVPTGIEVKASVILGKA